MKIIKKEGVEKIKVSGNNKLLLIIILLIVIFGVLVYFIIQNKNVNDDNLVDVNGKICVPASCCHATECMLAEAVLDCGKNFCSSVCSGPLDCNNGRCELINNKCEIVNNE